MSKKQVVFYSIISVLVILLVYVVFLIINTDEDKPFKFPFSDNNNLDNKKQTKPQPTTTPDKQQAATSNGGGDGGGEGGGGGGGSGNAGPDNSCSCHLTLLNNVTNEFEIISESEKENFIYAYEECKLIDNKDECDIDPEFISGNLLCSWRYNNNPSSECQ